MAHVDLKQLVARLNNATRVALEGAVGLCVSRTNYNVEIEHWLLKLLEQPNTDLVVLLRQFGVDHSRLSCGSDARHRRLPDRQLQGAGAQPRRGRFDP